MEKSAEIIGLMISGISETLHMHTNNKNYFSPLTCFKTLLRPLHSLSLVLEMLVEVLHCAGTT